MSRSMSITDPSHKILSAMVHKHTESPTLSCTSSTCSEEELKQQTHRLGRVVVEDDDNDDDDEQQVPSHPREEARDEAVVVSEKEQELFAAIETLNQLASMESSDYQARLVDNRLPFFKSHQQQPHLLKLSQSIHRFHSLVNNLCAENDQQTTELLELHRTVDTSQQRIEKLEKAVSKLHSRNVKLKKQSQSDKSVAGKLLEQVQTFRTNAARRNEEEEFFKLAQKVQQHEQVMMHTATPAASASASTNSSSMRERCDSNFSDLDQGLFQDFDCNKSVGSSTTDISSTKSAKSLVTDDGVATVRITRERVFTWPSNNSNNNTTTDPSDVPRSSSDDEAAVSVSPKPVVAESNHNNPFAMMFLSPKPAQEYTMSFSAPFSMQFVPLEVTVDQQPFAFAKSASASAPDGMEPPSIGETAFAVCGYHGFDSALNVKPTLGARLLEINKEVVCSSWSVEELQVQLEAQGKKSSKTKLTFRNDNWNREQKGALHLAVQEQERLHHPATARAQNKRTQNGDKPNLLGFLNFNHHGAGTTTSSSSKEEEEAEVMVSPQDQLETPESTTDVTQPGTTTRTTSPKDERVSPLNNIMLSFWKMNTPSPKNNQQQKPDEGVLFEDVDEEGLALPLPFSDETASSSDVLVDIEEDADEGDDGVKISESNSDEGDTGEQEEATPRSRSCSDAPNKPSSHNKQAADKFKSSMKNMGKLFAFR